MKESGLRVSSRGQPVDKKGDFIKRLTADLVKAGFIGWGNMGSRIAQRLLDHGYRVSVYDRNRAQTEAVAAHGGIAAKSVLELARSSDVVLSCLTNDEAVHNVYTGPEEFWPERSQEPLCWK
jgi:3-hydroxyisobutyrate dehydrogenase-like beta-hydroxyacid dehydrogenase